MDICTIGEDLIITPNPPVGQVKWGYPLSGAYANLPCEKNSAGTITPFGGFAVPTPPERFTTTLLQTAFPTTFIATSASKVYQNGNRVWLSELYTIVAGVVTMNVGQEEGTQIIIERF